jgi:sugar lactone lactonase YvrE
VSRCIAVDPETGAYTGGADGVIYHYNPAEKKLAKLSAKLPSVQGREPWATLDAAVAIPAPAGASGKNEATSVVGGTSDGFLFELRILGDGNYELNNWGKPSGQPGIQGLVARGEQTKDGTRKVIDGVAGTSVGMPRAFHIVQGPATFQLTTGGIPVVNGRATMEGFGAIAADRNGHIYAGEIDRVARLVRYDIEPAEKSKPVKRPAPQATTSDVDFDALLASAAALACRLVFAPEATTTEASGYTAIEVGRDGQVYVGSARYGDYAWLLRFPGTSLLGKKGFPAQLPTFMEKVVSMRDLSGEQREGINTQGKIHAKIVVGADGRIWFATKQAHESFAARPEYGEDPLGFPGGHLCYYNPATGFARSLGIPKHQEGLMAGAIDDARQTLYYRSEPKNHFLVYDLKTGTTSDRGNVGTQCRYMAIGKQGRVYTLGRDATLCRYDPETGYVEDLRINIEGAGNYKEPYVIAMGPNGKLYGASGGHPSIMEFDIDAEQRGTSQTVTMRNVASASPPGLPVIDIHAGVFGLDGRFYFPLNTSDPAKVRNRSAHKLFLMRFDPQTKQTELVGTPDIQDFDEEKVKHVYIRENVYHLDHMQGAAVGPDGTLYLMDIYPQLNIACFPGLTAP